MRGVVNDDIQGYSGSAQFCDHLIELRSVTAVSSVEFEPVRLEKGKIGDVNSEDFCFWEITPPHSHRGRVGNLTGSRHAMLGPPNSQPNFEQIESAVAHRPEEHLVNQSIPLSIPVHRALIRPGVIRDFRQACTHWRSFLLAAFVP